VPDPYAALGVGRDASGDEIRRAFRQAAKAAHPDAGGDSMVFRQLSAAVEELLDPVRRAALDRRLVAEPGAAVQGSATVQGGPVAGGPAAEGSVAEDPAAAVVAANLRQRFPVAHRRWILPPGGTAPADGLDGSVVVGRGDAGEGWSGVVCVGATGDVRWRAHQRAQPRVAPCRVDDVVVVAADGGVGALRVADGRAEWTTSLAAEPTTMVAVDGNRVVAASGGFVVGLDAATGTVRWQATVADAVVDLVWVPDVGVVVVVGTTTVAGLNPRTGRTRWWFRRSGPAPRSSGPDAAAVGTWLWLAGGDGQVTRHDAATGAARSVVDVRGSVAGLTALNGLLAVHTPGSIVVLRPGGLALWKADVSVAFTPPVACAGAAAIAVADGSLRFLSMRTGAEVHQVACEVPTGSLAGLRLTGDHRGVIWSADGAAIGFAGDTPDTP
jgi:outer membrane protein assembly factor BamB